MSAHNDVPHAKTFVDELAEKTGIQVRKCYQCGKCTAGCPMVPDMDFTPSQIMRLVQLGKREAALGSKTIWFCASCLTCTTRCPQEVKIAEVMDALRAMAYQEKKAHPAARKNVAFLKAFLGSVRRRGRLHEVGMVMDYKTRARDFFADLLLAPKMFLKGKLKLFGKPVKDRRHMARIFEHTGGKK
jgi:heterodisulfide reductase subunit C2